MTDDSQSLDDSTVVGINPSTLSVTSPIRPALTILWHPNPSHVGARCILAGSAPIPLSRLEPEFACSTRSPVPLGDTFLSRKPTLALAIAGSGIKISPLLPEVQVLLDGQPLTAPIALPAAAINSGVIITLGRRIALCLHFATPSDSPPDLGLLGNSDAINLVRHRILSFAKGELPVLIRGETGTGKELTARALVEAGPRASRPFVAVNLAALPSQLAASELFGHERGAFTGATSNRAGYFEEADGGSLFLDEIGLASPEVQATLLRVLETGEVRRLGGRVSRRVDVRLLAATDSTTIDQVAPGGGFSQPLFHRLSQATIHLPPLRARREDIGVLLLRFLQEELRRTGDLDKLDTPCTQKRPWLSALVVTTMAMAPWPGNVRQLRNVATELALANRDADSAQLPAHLATALAGPDTLGAGSGPHGTQPFPTTEGPSHEAVMEALARRGFNRAQAARDLGISRTTLYQHLRDDPTVGLLTRLSDAQFLNSLDQCNGDLRLLAHRMRVPLGSVKLRAGKL